MTRSTNQRQARRVALFDDFHVLDAQSGDLLGYVRDISSLGMMVVGATALNLDQVYELAVALPEPIVGEKILQLEATCRWRTFDAKRNCYKAGFQFAVLAQLENHIVEQIQTEYAFSVSESGA